ncbi:hypothetical protein H257_15645 [Aphanomyces astaci]|uniref:Myb/SANT-like domain-containing protein n=1 Tax=Aphanomyces astaci TaxID=112090 RepID=W4FNQ3_APHAT|nr:hypothetical protein H257_15645 [Aphanomyces astaci]ETV68323.1 hypothetical protein H257_15645 [Aphanomyces astaci]|eukprot:XP_009842118.1 hypothetical protein H257_15645 [Aphanomyces astaci]
MSDHEVQPPAEMVLDVATPKAKAGKRKEKKASSETKRYVRWCDESVATLFRLRYDSHLAKRFESKNNAEKKTAYVMLAAELSVAMESDYTVAQVQDKFSKLKTTWAMTKPSNPSDTGNAPLAPLPPHYDIMLEFWGSKKGYQRESLMSTDAIIWADATNSSDGRNLS